MTRYRVTLAPRIRSAEGSRPITLYRKMASGDPRVVTPYVIIGDVWLGPTIPAVMANKPFYFAWRCGGTDYSEFSTAGVEASIAQGYKVLEISVNQCATGEFVCIHNPTTTDVTGVNMTVRTTPWSTLKTLTTFKGDRLYTLTELMDQIGDRAAVAIDHKPTSAGEAVDLHLLQEENQLTNYLMGLIGWQDRFIWKTFGGAYPSQVRAKARGFLGLENWYEKDVHWGIANNKLVNADLIGMEYVASAATWTEVKALGKPTIGHIVQSAAAAAEAFSKGADGIMCGAVNTVLPV